MDRFSVFCRYLECSNYGLSEVEILDILSANRQIHQAYPSPTLFCFCSML